MNQVSVVKEVGNNNRVAVFWIIKKNGPCSRTEIAKSTGLSVMTVKKIVDVLIEKGVVQEEKLNTMVGRKPGLLTLTENLGSIICIDLSSPLRGRAVCYNLDWEEIGIYHISFSREISYEERLTELFNQIKADIPDIVGVGLSLAGTYSKETDSAPNDLVKQYKGVHFRELIFRSFQINNIYIGHDVHLAARYEAGIRQTDSLLYLYFGIGVGGSLIERGDTVLGRSLTAGEVGNSIIKDDGRTLQQVSSLMTLLVKQGYTDFHQLEEKAGGAGETLERQLLKEASAAVNRLIYNMIYFVNPKYIVIDSSEREYAQYLGSRAISFCVESMKKSELPAEFCIEVSDSEKKSNISNSLYHHLVEDYVVNFFDKEDRI